VLRFLNAIRRGESQFLSHDPSVVGEGALLGDRATMINSQDDRVFMRSMARVDKLAAFRRNTRLLALLAQ